MQHGSRKPHVSISSRMVAEPVFDVFDHGSTMGCVGEPSEADGGCVGYGTTRSTVCESAQQMVGTQSAGIEKSPLERRVLSARRKLVNLRRRVEKVA